jgi:1,2-phenylacetyl-CoA epoxidase PaaB subunit
MIPVRPPPGWKETKAAPEAGDAAKLQRPQTSEGTRASEVPKSSVAQQNGASLPNVVLPKSTGSAFEAARPATSLTKEADARTLSFAQRSSAASPLFARTVKLPSRDAQRLAEALAPAPAGASVQASDGKKLSAFSRFWRDFGINPSAMAKRAFVDKKPEDGDPIPNGIPADPLVMERVRQELHQSVESLRVNHPDGLSREALQSFKADLKNTFEKYGVDINFRQGAPTVAWGDLPRLEVMDHGGTAAAHELVHAVQCAIGGAAALSTAASAKIRREKKRSPLSETEILATIRTLSPEERNIAFERIVKPMESHAYAMFEEGAFHATGMYGKKAKDVEYYARGLRDNIDAYCGAYKHAVAPVMDEGGDAKFYGSIGHLARTHGETALLIGGTGVAYTQLATLALAINPVLGAAALMPLAYISWRTMAG